MINIDPDVQQSLLEAVRAEADDAIGYYDTVLTAKQSLALQYYEAQPFGDEVEGRSQYVMPDVAEVCDYMLQSVKRTILQSESPVEFQAKEAEQEDAAEEATKTVNYMFMRRQDGDKIINDFLQAGLIEDIGIIKTVRETEKVRKRDRVEFSSKEELAHAEQQGAEILDAEEYEDGTGVAHIQYEQEEIRYLDIPVPSEEFLFASRTAHEDDAIYLGHRTSKTMSELIEMGYDREVVEGLPVNHTDDETDERGYRRWDDEEWTRTERHGVMRAVIYHEEYIRFDYDDDGVAELLKVCRVENEILDIEEVDFQPFVVWTPFPRAHRMVGNGLAEKVMDIQRMRSLIIRNMIDGFAADNYPRPLIDENNLSENTIQDFMNPAPGAPIRYSGQAPTPYQTSFDLGKGISFLEVFNGERETRSGITRMNQGLDKEALNKTATGTAIMSSKGEQFEEYIARNFANAMCKLFSKKFQLIRDDGEVLNVRDGREIKEVNTGIWGDMDVVPRIGLGTGNQREKMEYRAGLLELQKEFSLAGSSLVDEEKIYNLVGDMIRDQKLGLPERYINEPQQQTEEQVDPEAQKMQAEALMQAEKMKGEQQLAAAKLDMQREENAANMAMKQQQAEQDIHLAWSKAEAELELAKWKAAAEAKLAAQKAKDSNLSDNRSGGSLAA